MAVIHYVKHQFCEPGVLSDNQYQYLKNQWAANPTFNPDSKASASFTGHFKRSLRWILGMLLLCLVLYLVYINVFTGKPNRFEWPRAVVALPAFIGGFIGFFVLINLFLEGPSYATYITDKDRYYANLAHAVRRSKDYHTFRQQFYPYVPNRKGVSPLTTNTTQADRLFVAIFHWIDRHAWKVVLLVAAILLLKKYVFKG